LKADLSRIVALFASHVFYTLVDLGWSGLKFEYHISDLAIIEWKQNFRVIFGEEHISRETFFMLDYLLGLPRADQNEQIDEVY
jgi:hypothetical protein